MYTHSVGNLTFIPGLILAERQYNNVFVTFKIILCSIVLQCCAAAKAQQKVDTAFMRVLTERASKIVSTLEIKDKAVCKEVTQQIAQQYYQLNAIHDQTKADVNSLKARNLSREETDKAVSTLGDKKSILLKQLHAQFLTLLQKRLTATQIEKVKDGMTYGVLPVTWTAYLDMLQNLTQEQKDQMYAWLVEARELAMDEGSSDAKHAVFGKYKGKINNYLSAQGYDMKREGEEWAKRIAAKKDKQKSN